jgi:agmatinase
VEVAPNYDVSDGNSYNGGITSGLANRLIVELLAGLSLTKKGQTQGKPVRPKLYRGTGHTYDFDNGPHAKVPKRAPLNYGNNGHDKTKVAIRK